MTKLRIPTNPASPKVMEAVGRTDMEVKLLSEQELWEILGQRNGQLIDCAKKCAAFKESNAELLAALNESARFLVQLAEHLEGSEMPGTAGNCMIHVKRINAAVERAEGRTA